MVLLTELATLLAFDIGAARGKRPRAQSLEAADIALNGEHRTMLGNPAKFVLSPLQSGAQILIGLRGLRTLSGGIQPVQRSVAKSRSEGVSRNNDPHHGRCG